MASLILPVTATGSASHAPRSHESKRCLRPIPDKNNSLRRPPAEPASVARCVSPLAGLWRLNPCVPAGSVVQGFRFVHFRKRRADLSDPDARESTSFVESIFKRPGRFSMQRSPNLNQAIALLRHAGPSDLNAPGPIILRGVDVTQPSIGTGSAGPSQRPR